MSQAPSARSTGTVFTPLREIGLLLLLAVTGYLVVSLLTYSPQDPGPTHGGSGRDVVNLGGRAGAWFADLMFSMFGSVGYLFLALVFAWGWRLYRERVPHNPWSQGLLFAGVMLAMIGACGLENLYFPHDSSNSAVQAGGILGQSGAHYLIGSFGLTGATVIFIAALITGVTLVTHLSWFALMDRTGYLVFAALIWLRERLSARADRSEGVRTRRRRHVSVKKLRTDLSERKPPKIEPRMMAATTGERPLRERQENLFAVDSADLPPLSLLTPPEGNSSGYSHSELEAMSQLLVKKLKDFHVEVTVEAVQPGPVITRFEIDPAPGIKASQIVGLSRDLARSLSVESVRVVENIPGKTVVGIEIPNQSREVVRLVEGLSSKEYEKSASPLTLVLGKDIAGSPAITDLMKMPHLLIAGTTGSGKSVCVNALILSLLYKATPEQVRLIMVDPKFLELSVYDGIPHLLTPVVTDMTQAANALRWCIGEMDRRFRVMAAIGVRNIAGYNHKVADAAAAGEPLVDPLAAPAPDHDGAAEEESAPPPLLTSLPCIVVVVDELADLMMVVGKKLEEIIIRIAQRARAAGIHLVLATQRPSVDVVTGLIKANVPTRIAFQVSSRVDSRTVLDQMGAEQLLGQGDMLFLPPGNAFTRRVHGSFVSDEEVARVVAHLKQGARPIYIDQITAEGGTGTTAEGGAAIDGEGDGESDPLYDQAVQFVQQSGRASISSVQRALRVGYNRAARMIDTMEEAGVVSPADNGKRTVLIPQQEE